MEKDRQEGPVKKHANQSYVFYPYISSTGKPIDKYFSAFCYCFDTSINTQQPYLNSSMWYFNTLRCLILPQYLHQVRLEHPSQKPPSGTLLSVYVLLKICLMTYHYHSIQARNLYVIVGCHILRNHKYPSAYKGVDQRWLEENVTRKTHDMEWSKVKSGEVDIRVNLAERSWDPTWGWEPTLKPLESSSFALRARFWQSANCPLNITKTSTPLYFTVGTHYSLVSDLWLTERQKGTHWTVNL